MVPGTDLPYMIHLSNVSMEVLIAAQDTAHFDLGLAIQVALLNDTLEDTKTTKENFIIHFGMKEAEGVPALINDTFLPKHKQMEECFSRIKQ